MKNTIKDNLEIKEKVQKGLELTFKKLLLSKQRVNGIFAVSENGTIRKIKASDIHS